MSLCLRSLQSLHPPIALHCALVSVWPTSSSASAQRGPVGPRKRPPQQLASVLCWGVSQSVSSQYHSVSAPAGCSSSSESQNRLSIQPPRAHTFEVRLGKRTVPIWLLLRLLLFSGYLCLLSLFPSAPATWAGDLGLLGKECVVEYCKRLCVTCVKWTRNCTHSFCFWFEWWARFSPPWDAVMMNF